MRRISRLPVLNALELRQLVERAEPADHARLSAHFGALAERYATEAQQHERMAQASNGQAGKSSNADLRPIAAASQSSIASWKRALTLWQRSTPGAPRVRRSLPRRTPAGLKVVSALPSRRTRSSRTSRSRRWPRRITARSPTTSPRWPAGTRPTQTVTRPCPRGMAAATRGSQAWCRTAIGWPRPLGPPQRKRARRRRCTRNCSPPCGSRADQVAGPARPSSVRHVSDQEP